MKPFDVTPFSLAASKVEEILRADPRLNAASGVRLWHFGTTCDQRPEIDSGSLPAVLGTFKLADPAPMDESGWRFALVLSLDLFVPSLDARDSFDLYGAVLNALFPPGSNAVVNELLEIGAYNHSITGIAPDPYPLDGGAPCALSQGEITLLVRFDS